jgi:hypothetical protein
MAWRIGDSVLGGELDFTVRGRVTGSLAVEGRDGPIRLGLDGLPWADLAGHRISFRRKQGGVPAVPLGDGFVGEQVGLVGDMTASRKVRSSALPIEEILDMPRDEVVWNWENCLYLEWFSEGNGRVVLESTGFDLSIESVGAWELGPHETPPASGEPNPFLSPADHFGSFDDYLPVEDDSPKSAAEIEADREAARMDLLNDRIGRRLEREGHSAETFDRIFKEERARLQREFGEPSFDDPEPEEEGERQRWDEEINAASAFIEGEFVEKFPWDVINEEAALAGESLDDEEFDEDDFDEEVYFAGGYDEDDEFDEDDDALDDDEEHPLVERSFLVAAWLRRDLVDRAGGDEALPPEHPFFAIAEGVQFATAKLAGALNGADRRDEWPPHPLFAGDCLVRLKKARGYLHDALAGVRSAEEDGLLGGIRLDEIRAQVGALLASVEEFIAEVRKVLE